MSNASVEPHQPNYQPRRFRQSSPVQPIVIRDPSALSAFAVSRAFASTQPLVLQLPGMTPAHAFAAAERINVARAACGCALGAQAMAGAFVVTLALLMIRYGPFTLDMLERTPIALGAAFVFAAFGKAIGVARARARARREVAHILSTLTRP